MGTTSVKDGDHLCGGAGISLSSRVIVFKRWSSCRMIRAFLVLMAISAARAVALCSSEAMVRIVAVALRAERSPILGVVR